MTNNQSDLGLAPFIALDEDIIFGKLDAVADAGNVALFVNLVEQIDWRTRSTGDFTRVVRLALLAGAHLKARELAALGARRYPNDPELQKMDYILAPPTLVGTEPASNSGIRANNDWLRERATEYPHTLPELIAHLGQFVTENRRAKIAQVLEYRTRHVTIVLEDIYQPQNASATLRTSECLGLQDVYIIENRNRYRINRNVTLGSSKWLTLHRFNAKDQDNTPNCLQTLRERGYTLVATSPTVDGCTPDDIPIDKPIAFLFGAELEGLTQYALDSADLHLRLPIFGFTQSYNISVSVAMTLSRVVTRLHESGIPWRLTGSETQKLTLAWYRKIVDRAEIIERVFLEERGD
ncbi:MAG: TrmH family RNA methyltransferase [Anaerolineales bacterium]